MHKHYILFSLLILLLRCAVLLCQMVQEERKGKAWHGKGSFEFISKVSKVPDWRHSMLFCVGNMSEGLP